MNLINYSITVTMTFMQNIICICKLVFTIVNNTDWIILIVTCRPASAMTPTDMFPVSGTGRQQTGTPTPHA